MQLNINLTAEESSPGRSSKKSLLVVTIKCQTRIIIFVNSNLIDCCDTAIVSNYKLRTFFVLN